jgi:hypothetical protein
MKNVNKSKRWKTKLNSGLEIRASFLGGLITSNPNTPNLEPIWQVALLFGGKCFHFWEMNGLGNN